MLFSPTNKYPPRVCIFLATHISMLPNKDSNPIFDHSFTTHISMLPNKDSKPIFDHSFTNTTMGKFKTKGFRDQNCHKSEESDDEAASTISNGSSSSSSSSICSSSSSFDTTDDASSSSSSSRSSLYDLSDLMSQLPIKRGLSKFYHGKSDSFTSLARVTSIEDLPKKEKRIKKMKAINYKSHILPKPIISKKKLSSSIFKSST